ncbi:hypothetical protein CJ195_20130 [Bacillus sp. UMB0899]|nr:hypothetical protein CJ195_20130 [Bacillus sp. UMB0899]
MARKIWGVDSVGTVDQDFYNTVRKQLGVPKYWGRNLTEIPNVTSGLTKMEINFLRNKGIKILPIYTIINKEIGYEQAQIAGRNAVYHARRLGFPQETVIFANIENLDNVNALWIRGWVETLLTTGYRAGFHHLSQNGDFTQAFCQVVKENHDISLQAILWSAETETGISSERKAPRFNPVTPNCKANVWLWKYGRDFNNDLINTNLADERVLKFLY